VTLGKSRPKSEAQKIKTGDWMISSTIAVLTVRDPGLFRVQFQLTFPKSGGQLFLQSQGFGLRSTMNNPIIGITAKGQLRMVPLHPGIEHIMQKEIG
jgi:hypothetical protein